MSCKTCAFIQRNLTVQGFEAYKSPLLNVMAHMHLQRYTCSAYLGNIFGEKSFSRGINLIPMTFWPVMSYHGIMRHVCRDLVPSL